MEFEMEFIEYRTASDPTIVKKIPFMEKAVYKDQIEFSETLVRGKRHIPYIDFPEDGEERSEEN